MSIEEFEEKYTENLEDDFESWGCRMFGSGGWNSFVSHQFKRRCEND